MITSLHSPHVERVKALSGSRGNKARREQGLFVAEGLQSVREALTTSDITPRTIYLTDSGRTLLSQEDLISERYEFIDVTDQVMAAMTDTVTPQGIVAICEIPHRAFSEFVSQLKSRDIEKKTHQILRIAYFWQIQDPGNAGTVIRTADAFSFDAVVFSPDSVDPYAPKVVRSSAGSLWHIPIFTDVAPEQLSTIPGIRIFITDGAGGISLSEAVERQGDRSAWIFGNEARGIATLPAELVSQAESVVIPMSGSAESLNIASATSIVLYSARLKA